MADATARPYKPLFQERWRKRPFWMLVGCILVNRARWQQAEPVHAELMRRWPSVGRLGHGDEGAVAEVVRPLGFHRSRSRNLVALAKAWRALPARPILAGPGPLDREDVLALPGCGKYAADSWSIFVLHDELLEGVTDKRLLEYQAERRRIYDEMGRAQAAAEAVTRSLGGAT